MADIVSVCVCLASKSAAGRTRRGRHRARRRSRLSHFALTTPRRVGWGSYLIVYPFFFDVRATTTHNARTVRVLITIHVCKYEKKIARDARARARA